MDFRDNLDNHDTTKHILEYIESYDFHIESQYVSYRWDSLRTLVLTFKKSISDLNDYRLYIIDGYEDGYIYTNRVYFNDVINSEIPTLTKESLVDYSVIVACFIVNSKNILSLLETPNTIKFEWDWDY